MEIQQNSTTPPLGFLLTDATMNPVCGATPVVYGLQNGTPYTPQGAVTEATISSPAITGAVIGTAGTTTYQYATVVHSAAGAAMIGATLTITNGNATLSSSDYVQLSGFSTPGACQYDVLKNVSGTWALLATTSGANVSDQGQATSAYTLPTVNTTSGGLYHLSGNAADRSALGTIETGMSANGGPTTWRQDTIVQFAPTLPMPGKPFMRVGF